MTVDLRGVSKSSINIECRSEISSPEISIIVVSYGASKSEFANLCDGLSRQTGIESGTQFELVVIDNGVDFSIHERTAKFDFGVTFASSAKNLGVTSARNLGASLANGDLLIFLDDDAVPDQKFVRSHHQIHNKTPTVACRGRVVPKNESAANYLQSHYDLGDSQAPYLLNIEGNMSISREKFRDVGGFDTNLEGRAGGEGIVLTYKLLSSGVSREHVIYHPDPVIYHDYSTDLLQCVYKELKHADRHEFVTEEYKKIEEFRRSYPSPPSTTPPVKYYLPVRLTQLILKVIKLMK